MIISQIGRQALFKLNVGENQLDSAATSKRIIARLEVAAVIVIDTRLISDIKEVLFEQLFLQSSHTKTDTSN